MILINIQRAAFKSFIAQRDPETFGRQKRLLRTYFIFIPISFVVMWWRRLILRVIANWFCAVHLKELKWVLRVLFTITAPKDSHPDHWFNFFLTVIAFWATKKIILAKILALWIIVKALFGCCKYMCRNTITHMIFKHHFCGMQQIWYVSGIYVFKCL